MQGIKDLISGLVAARMDGDHGSVEHDFKAIHISFDTHCLKSTVTGDAVTDLLELHELIFIDFGFLADAGIETA